jgi:hypothetical protein
MVTDASIHGIPRLLQWTSTSGATLSLPAWRVLGCQGAPDPTRHQDDAADLATPSAAATNILKHYVCGGADDAWSNTQGYAHPAHPGQSWSSEELGVQVLFPTGTALVSLLFTAAGFCM